jgi:hypothetical protein
LKNRAHFPTRNRSASRDDIETNKDGGRLGLLAKEMAWIAVICAWSKPLSGDQPLITSNCAASYADRGWLTISNSEKRDFKDKTLRTKKGRTPLAHKGLGRLGTQRLGYNVDMFTRSEGSPTEHHVRPTAQLRLLPVGIEEQKKGKNVRIFVKVSSNGIRRREN